MAIPSQTVASAISAYTNIARGAAPNLGASPASLPNTFGAMVQNVIQRTIDANKQGEALSIAAINDKADLNKVVTAIAEAELMLQTVTTVRDKVIDAYKEIIRMPM